MNLFNAYSQDNSNNSEAPLQPKTFISQPIYTASETANDRTDNSSNSDSANAKSDRPDKNERHSDWIRLNERLFAYS